MAIGDVALCYEAEGSGPPLVLLHGFAQDRRVWHAQVPALAADRTVVRYDLRGFGRSTSSGTPYRHADDLEALLGRRRVEHRRREEAADLSERLVERRRHRLRARRRHHPAARANEDRIPRHLPEPRERVAHRRLRQPDPRRGACHVSFLEQRAQRDEQVQVERGEVHGRPW